MQITNDLEIHKVKQIIMLLLWWSCFCCCCCYCKAQLQLACMVTCLTELALYLVIFTHTHPSIHHNPNAPTKKCCVQLQVCTLGHISAILKNTAKRNMSSGVCASSMYRRLCLEMLSFYLCSHGQCCVYYIYFLRVFFFFEVVFIF